MAYGGQSSPEGSLLLENFECSICLQVYMRPKILPCGHTFCMECLVLFVDGSKSFQCPTCQTRVELNKAGRVGVETLIDNISLANLRDDVNGRSRRGPQEVENLTAEDGKSVCLKHQGEELRCYCPKCDAVICEECMFEDHNTHGVNRLRKTLQEQTAMAREVSKEGRRLMTQIRAKITELENTMKRLNEEESTQVKAVDKTAQKLAEDFASEVQKRAKALKDELHNFFAPSNNMILHGKERLETQLAQLASRNEALDRCGNLETITVFYDRKLLLNELIEMSSKATTEYFGVETECYSTALFTPAPHTLPEFTLGKVRENVPLHKSENAWKPGVKTSEEMTADERETEEILRKVQGILNKLTPQKFQTLCQQVLDLDISSEERLKGVVDLVFEHATTVMKYSVAYANMCRCLIHLKVPMEDNPKQTVTFRKLLLSRCQREFEKDKELQKRDWRKKIELAKNDADRKIMEIEFKREVTRARRRSLGNIRFIGELFKLKMLTKDTMHECVVKLLKSDDEESLEGLCILLTTIGKDLDVGKEKHKMGQYLGKIEQIIKQKKTSSRVRFKLQDVIDLSMNNWIPKSDNNPKTIGQMEAKLEGKKAAEDYSYPTPTANKARVPYQTGPRYSAPQTVTLSPPLQMFQHPNQMIPMDTVRLELEKLLKEKADNDMIVAWIEKHVGARAKKAAFIRALMTAVCRSAVVVVGKGARGLRCDTQAVQKRVVLLQKYLDNESTRELQALFALQALMVQLDQPPNLLRAFFDVLYDKDVILEDTFYAWKSNTDPAEQEGKKVALKSVTAFFCSLIGA